MKMILAVAAFAMLAVVPARAAPAFSLTMVQSCAPGGLQHTYDLSGVPLPVCLADVPFLTAADIASAHNVALRQAPPPFANPHILHLTLTADAAQRLTALSRENRDESFVALVDDHIVAMTSIGDPFRSAELELLISLDDPTFAALLQQLNKVP